MSLSDGKAETHLKILVIDENPIRTAILREGLKDAGFEQVSVVSEMTGLVDQIYRLDPDVLIIDLENPNRDLLEQMFQVSRAVKRPIAMFVDQSEGSDIQAAVEAGVSTYIVDGLTRERVRPIIDLTLSRFRAFTKLENELEAARTALEERKIIDRAKGLLMESKAISEDAAYALLRKTAMNQNKRIADVAEALVNAAELLK